MWLLRVAAFVINSLGWVHPGTAIWIANVILRGTRMEGLITGPGGWFSLGPFQIDRLERA